MKPAFARSGMEHVARSYHVYYGLKLKNLRAVPIRGDMTRFDANCGFGRFSTIGHTGVFVRNRLVESTQKLMGVRV